VVFGLAPGAPDAPTVVARANEAGVLLVDLAPRRIRAVTHLDVSRDDCERAARVIVEAVAGG
jgi:threonine aldolase